MEQLQEAREIAKKLCRIYFRDDDGQSFELTDGQADIFYLIFTKAYRRNQIIAYTQYGKSEVVAMALVMRVKVYGDKWAVISTSKDKSMIIMGKVIQHIFDHPEFMELLEPDENMPLDRLKRERSKDHLTFKNGGAIRAFTANAKNRQAVREALTGFGSRNIVEDEASLIPDDVQAMVLRMLGGFKDSFLLKIGNPFYRNHFLKSWQSDKYFKLVIDYLQGLREKRVAEEFIEEMRSEAFFDVLYECKFPDRDSLLTGGYRALIPEELLESAFISYEEGKELMVGRVRLGGDIGGGGDRSAYVLRWKKVMWLKSVNKIQDTMQQVPIVEDIIKEYEIEDFDVSLDYGGLGQGASDRLVERGREINKVMFGESSPEPDKYMNMRAYMYYRLLRWLKKGGRIVRDNGFLELLSVNYKSDSERKFKIQPKEELKKVMKDLGIQAGSPDIGDAAALTFADNSKLVTENDFGFA